MPLPGRCLKVLCSMRRNQPNLYLLAMPSQAEGPVRKDFQASDLPVKEWDAKTYGYGRGAGPGGPQPLEVTLIAVAVSLAVRVGEKLVDRATDRLADTFLDAVGKATWDPSPGSFRRGSIH